MEVPLEQIHLYGCVAVEPTDTEDVAPGHRPGREAVAPRRRRAPTPSSAATCSTPRSSTPCGRPRPGQGGEIQLTDALQGRGRRAEGAGGGVHGVVFRGRRYDTGDRLDYLKAVVRLACEREDLGPELRAWLREFVQGEGLL